MTLRNECPSFFSTFDSIGASGDAVLQTRPSCEPRPPISLDRAIDRPHRHHECERARSAAAHPAPRSCVWLQILTKRNARLHPHAAVLL